MTNPVPTVLRQQLVGFSQWRRAYLTGDEKGQAQVFCDRLFQAFGHGGVHEAGAVLEMRLRRNDQGGTAFADLVWKPRCLIEMKKAGTDLGKVYRQAFDYWVQAVPNRPRYVVLCNFDEFWIYDFDYQLDAPMDVLAIDDLGKRSDAMGFLLPDAAKPVFGNDLVTVTREAAGGMGHLFQLLHERGVKRPTAQRFVLQCVMAMFAEDIGLLPGKYFTRALEDAGSPDDAYDLIHGLFVAMNSEGETPAGRYRGTPYFNGGLFSEIAAVELNAEEFDLLHRAAVTDWSGVRPEIFGTLFEGSMEAGERHAHGAHFTSQVDIAKVVTPTIVEPWRERIESAGTVSELEAVLAAMLSYRVLDPACGSGNFLYVAYRELRRLDHDVRERITARRRAARYRGQQTLAYVVPENFFGIDINPFAVEVAKVTMMLAKKLAADELGEAQAALPLDNLDANIVAADALFTAWPRSDAVIGNPPYLGRRKLIQDLGAAYSQRLAQAYPGVSGVSDFVSYWFPKTQDHLPRGGRAGLVGTNTVRQNETREASLDYVVDHGGVITEAVSSQPWSGDAAVHVSIINWIKEPDARIAARPKVLWVNDGELRLELPAIPPALTAEADVRSAKALPANRRPTVIFQGQTPGVTEGFQLDEAGKASLIAEASSSASYIHPFLGGNDMLDELGVRRFIIDLPHDDLVLATAEAPALIAHLRRHVLPTRTAAAQEQEEANRRILEANADASVNRHHIAFLNKWWRLGYRRADMLAALKKLDRYIATSRVASEHRATVFEFLDPAIHPGDGLSVVALSDDYSFGVLSSSVHRTWLEARCSTLENRLRYTSTTVWDSFPWPQTPTDRQVAAIVDLVDKLLNLRSSYLARGVPLSGQYNALRQPGNSMLRELHQRLDAAVMTAYGFAEGSDVRVELLALNQTLTASSTPVFGPGGGRFARNTKTTYRRVA